MTANEKHDAPGGARIAFVLVVCLYALWGMAHNLNDILIAQFKKAFVLSDFETSFVQQAFYLGYFLMAVPAAMVTHARGYKAAIIAGLLLYAAGALLFYPAAQWGEYRYFLVALFVIACGLAFLETSANPLMTELGSPEGAARRLNWAQAANPLGTIAGVLVGKYFILSGIVHDERSIAALAPDARIAFYRNEIAAVQTPYLVIGLVVLAFALAAAVISFPAARYDSETTRPVPFRGVFAQPRLLFAVVAQFFYVGAQVGLWSYTIRYAGAAAGLAETAGADMLFASLILFGIGRFVGTALMTRVAPAALLATFATISIALTLVAALVGGTVGLYALVATSFFLSIQFPTIFALGIAGLGPLRQAGASLIIMAIIGGAALTALLGHVSDRFGITHAMLVPAACFVMVLLFAWREMRADRHLLDRGER